MKILIIEDDPINRKYLETILASFGDVESVSDGLEGMKLIERAIESHDLYDVVFLDIMMPKMDGHETLQAIRRLEEIHKIGDMGRVKVIMVTALTDRENLLSAFSEGCECYLVKPFKQDKVVQLMEELGFKSTD